MPTTRKQKKTRKSRGVEIISDIENVDMMLGENHFSRNERDESLSSNQTRRPESTFGDQFENNDENRYLNSRNDGLSPNADYGQNSAGGNSSAEINRLSSELNSRISREMDEMMNSVSVQIQRAINDAISNQVLPQIQNAIVAGSGHLTRERWNVPAERPEGYSEVLRNSDSRDNSRSKPFMDCQKDGPTTSTNARAYDNLIQASLFKDCLVPFELVGTTQESTLQLNSYGKGTVHIGILRFRQESCIGPRKKT